jgi:hypothetical protein
VVDGYGKGNCSNSGFGGGRTTVTDNCTVINCDTGITISRNAGDTVIVRNNVCQGNTTGFALTGSGGTYTHSGNISDDTTSPEASLQSTTVAFVNAAGGDYHLATAGSAADATGTDLSAAAFGFTVDRDGVTRTVPWSSGAYEALPSTQTARAVSDVSVSGWTTDTGATTGLAAAVSDQSDTTWITSTATPSNDSVELALDAVDWPEQGDVTLTVRQRGV